MCILSLLIILPFVAAQGSQTCYWPDGTETTSTTNARNYYPCREGPSQCCGEGEVCLSNGLCFESTEGGIYRGACTDKTWQTSNCNNLCLHTWPRSKANLHQCLWDETRGWKWWCGFDNDAGNTCSVENANNTFFVYPRGTVDSIVTNGSAASASSSTSLSPPEASSTSARDAAPAACPASGGKKDNTTTEVAVGVGVGAPLGLLALAFGILFFKERKRRLKAETVPVIPSTDSGYQQISPGHDSKQQYALYEMGEGRDRAELGARRLTGR